MLRCPVPDSAAAPRLRAVVAALGVALALGACRRDDSPATSLVLLTLDTTRADRLQPYGAAGSQTPTLARLAGEGALFERLYAVSPTTLPAHATLLTGTDPIRHGVRQNGLHQLAPEVSTLAEILAPAGFDSAAFVSAAVLERGAGLAQGFAVYDDATTNLRHEVGREDERSAGETVAAARAWLDGRPPAGRLFLWVHLFDPHSEYRPPSPWAERFAAHPYLGEIAYMDAQIGELLAHPRLAGDDVLVVAIGDHGESLGAHGEDNHGLLLYDATLHVPWIVRGPGVAAGRRIAAPVTQVDLLPTVLDLLGLDPPAELVLDGASQAARLRADRPAGEAAPPPARLLYAETFYPYYSYGWASLRSLRDGDLKLVQAPTPELYDTAADPGETTNLFAERRRDAHRLLDALAARVAADAGPAAPRTLDREASARLQSLGYVSGSHAGEIDDARRLDPKTVIDLHAQIRDARDALYRFEAAPAAVALRRVLERDPNNLTALEKLALALALLGDTEEALDVLGRAVAIDPSSSELALVQAHVHALRGEAAQSLALADGVIAREPDTVEAWVERAFALETLGRAGEAKAALERAVELDPKNPRAVVGIVELVELPAGETETAAERLEALLPREARRPEVWRALGRVYEAEGRDAEAADAYRRGLAEQPRAGTLHAHLGVLLARLGDPGAEAALAAAAQELRPVPAMVHRGMALAALGRKDGKAAAAAARRALDLDQGDASAWNLLAAGEEEQGRFAAALAGYDSARRVDPRHVPARFNKALLLRRLERFREAADELAEVLALDPDHAGAHYELGVLYGGPLGDPAEARRQLQLALDSGHPQPERVRRLLAALGSPG